MSDKEFKIVVLISFFIMYIILQTIGILLKIQRNKIIANREEEIKNLHLMRDSIDYNEYLRVSNISSSIEFVETNLCIH